MSASQYKAILAGGSLPEPPHALLDGPLHCVEGPPPIAAPSSGETDDEHGGVVPPVVPLPGAVVPAPPVDPPVVPLPGAVVPAPPVAPPVDPPVVPAPPVAYVAHPVYDVDIRGDGQCQFRHDTMRFFIAAHCRHPLHGSNCRANRQYRAHPRAPRVKPSQGRPGGTLLAWMKCADDFPDAASHQAILKPDTVTWHEQLTLDKRTSARDWCERNYPEFAEFLRHHERAPWPGEGEEPLLPC